MRFSLLVCALSLAACGTSTATPDASPDVVAVPDAPDAAPDAPAPDASALDASAPDASAPSDAACATCVDYALDPARGRCDAYAARPVICRTHGLALRFRDDARSLPLLDACPKNYEGVALDGLDPATVLDQTTLSTILAALDPRGVPRRVLQRLRRGRRRGTGVSIDHRGARPRGHRGRPSPGVHRRARPRRRPPAGLTRHRPKQLFSSLSRRPHRGRRGARAAPPRRRRGRRRGRREWSRA